MFKFHVNLNFAWHIYIRDLSRSFKFIQTFTIFISKEKSLTEQKSPLKEQKSPVDYVQSTFTVDILAFNLFFHIYKIFKLREKYSTEQKNPLKEEKSSRTNKSPLYILLYFAFLLLMICSIFHHVWKVPHIPSGL